MSLEECKWNWFLFTFWLIWAIPHQLCLLFFAAGCLEPLLYVASHLLVCSTPQNEFISLHSNTGGIRKKKRECSTWPSTESRHILRMVLFWLHSGKVTVFQPCSDIMKSLSSYKWSGKGTIRSSLTKETFHVLAGPESFPRSERSTDKRNSFPRDFQASVCLCFVHVSTETRDGMQTLEWEEF